MALLCSVLKQIFSARGGITLLLVIFLAITAQAQNTKGDKPVAPGRQTRETRFKVRGHKGDHARTKDIAGRRLRTKNYHSPNRANLGAPSPKARRQGPEHEMDRPYQAGGYPIGRRLHPKNREGARASNYYPPSGPYVSNPSRKPGQHHPDWSREAKRIPVRKPSNAPHRTYNPANFSKARRIPSSPPVHYNAGNNKPIRRSQYNPANHIFSQNGTYVHNPSREPGGNHPKWGKPSRRITGQRPGTEARRTYRPGNFKVSRISPGNAPHRFYPASGPYVNNPSPRPERAQPYSNRQKLSRIARVSSQPPGPGKHRILVQSGSHSFISRRSTNFMARFPRPKPRSNVYAGKDLTGHPLLKRNYHSQGQYFQGAVSPYANRKGGLGDHAYSGKKGRYKSATRTQPVPWRGDIAGRQVRGRNYRSTLPGALAQNKARIAGQGAAWNNGGKAIVGRAPTRADQQVAGYQGNIRSYGKGRAFSPQGENYAGNIKVKKPARGAGGSVSASWNNGGKPVVGKGPSGSDQEIARYQGNIRSYGKGRAFSPQGENYAGNIKVKKPAKGAGQSVTISWNNNQKALPGRSPTSYDNKIASFSGTLKARKPQHGGMSESHSWNNEGKAIAGRGATATDNKARSFSGTIKAQRPLKGAGESESIGMWNNKQKAIAVKLPANPDAWRTRTFQGTVRAKAVSNSKDNSTEGLHIKVKEPDYTRNKSADEKALKGIAPSRSSIVATNSSKGVKQDWQYVRNPKSDNDALKVRDPGRAVARASSYRGDVRMHRYPLFSQSDAYPDVRFQKTKKDNVDGERGIFNSVLLMWGKIFGKGGTMPSSTKEKDHRPRFDKGEKGLWYD